MIFALAALGAACVLSVCCAIIYAAGEVKAAEEEMYRDDDPSLL